MSFNKLGGLLDNSLTKKNIKKGVQAVNVMDTFLDVIIKIFGEDIKTKVKPLYIKNKILKVSVISSVLSTEIKLKEDKIISQINRKHKTETIEKISVQL